jgi:hypothetical protein
MANTQTIGMENAVIVMQHLSKSDWCWSWYNIYGKYSKC